MELDTVHKGLINIGVKYCRELFSWHFHKSVSLLPLR